MAQNGDFIVGVQRGEVVAMGAFRRLSDDVAELKRMRVRPDLQSRGIGRDVLALLEVKARIKGFTTVKLDTTVLQIAAQRLYETSGYIETHRETEGWPVETIFYRKELV